MRSHLAKVQPGATHLPLRPDALITAASVDAMHTRPPTCMHCTSKLCNAPKATVPGLYLFRLLEAINSQEKV